ncbi:MAG: hypothetical protein LBL79_09725 [Prevotella sp.]|nr:hypothetical protein [Prevotella sp.]
MVDGDYYESENYYFYITDHLGNNRIVTDAAASVVQSTQYYPLGTAFADAMGQDVQPYKYNGKELDARNGLNMYDYSARWKPDWYFTTIDPMAEKYYSISPYAYCLNNPLKYIDPDGMDVYMIFYTTSDERFKAAAETRQREIEKQKGFDKTKDHVYIQELGDLGTLGERVNNMVADATKNGYGQTAEASFWGHSGAEDGPRSDVKTSGEYATTDGGKNQLKGEGWSNINFNFSKDNSVAAFYGCNSSTFAEKFLDYQPSVAFTAGQGGSAGPSYSTDKFNSVSPIYGYFGTSKNVYYGTVAGGNFVGPTVYTRKLGVENYDIVRGNASVLNGKLQNIMK